MIVEGILCIRFVHMCVTDSIVHKCVPVKDESLLPIVLCCFMKVHSISHSAVVLCHTVR